MEEICQVMEVLNRPAFFMSSHVLNATVGGRGEKNTTSLNIYNLLLFSKVKAFGKEMKI